MLKFLVPKDAILRLLADFYAIFPGFHPPSPATKYFFFTFSPVAISLPTTIEFLHKRPCVTHFFLARNREKIIFIPITILILANEERKL